MATTTATAPRLAIKVLEARGVGLRSDADDAAPLAPADIFVQVVCGGEAFQTETRSQTTAPVWGQETVFGGDSLKALGDRASFKVFANGDAIGDAFVEIGTLEPDVTKQIVLGLGAGADGQGTGWTASALDAGVDGAVIAELVIEVLYEPQFIATVLPKLTPVEPVVSPRSAAAAAVKAQPVAPVEVEPEEPAGPQLPPNYIVVTVLEAKELVALDGKGEGAVSDPFVKISCSKNAPQKTKVVEKTLHPKWRQRFFFYLTHTRQVLDLVMEDSDMFQNDFMGQVSIDLEQWKENFEHEKRVIWLGLERAKPEGDTSVSDIGPERHLNYGLGKICISIEMRHIERDIENLEQGEIDHATVVPSSRNPRVTSGLSGVRSLSGQDSSMSDGLRDHGDGVPVPEDDDDKESVTQETADEIKKRQEERQKMFAELSNVQFLSGDYQVLVRIIEVRDLKPMDVNGLCDPVVSVECMGQRQHTMVKEKQLSCVFDEYLSFNFRNLDKDTVQQSSITITVLDADGPGSTSLSRFSRLCSNTIGFFAVDIPYVYFQKDHEVHRKWVALVGSGKTNSDSIQGYLLLSIVVLGPGDKLKMHAPHEDRPVEEAPAAAVVKKDINSLVLIPPRVIQTLSYLVVTVHQAIDLPDMDKGMVREGGLDGYVRVSLAGQDVLETKRVTVKGGSDLAIEFNQELWFPILLPTMSNKIVISLWDWDLTADELVGNTSSYMFNMVQKYPNLFKSHWANLYGPPTGFRTEPQARKHMFAMPKAASTYRGRLLLSLRIEDGSKSVHDRPHTRNLTVEPPQVPTRSYCLRTAVFFGTEIPRFVSKTSWNRNSKMSLKISIGKYEVKSTRVENRNGMCYWNQYIDIPDIELPVDLEHVPDVFVHLVRQQLNEVRYICYARFSAKDLFKPNAPSTLDEIQTIPAPEWVSLIEDQAMNDLKDHDFTGNVLMNLSLEPSPSTEIVKEIAQKWREHAAENLSYTKYTLFVHVFQAKCLPAADTNGVLDPYVKVTCAGAEGKVNMRIATRDPCFYETVSLDIDLPQNKAFLPKVSVQVFDWDQWDTDDYFGAAKFSLTDFPLLTSSQYNKQRANGEYKPPRPEWHPIARTKEGDTEGELLLSFELIRKETPGIVIDPPESIRPPMEDRFVEITCLGCRGLQPVGFMPVNTPFVKFEIGEVSKTNGGVRFTNPSSKPSGRNPNFLERIVVPVKMPLDALYAPRLTISVFDQLLGGFYKPLLGTCSVDLSKKMPLSNGEANPLYVETIGEGFGSNPYVAHPADYSTFPGNLPTSVIEEVSSASASSNRGDHEERKEEEPPADRGAGVAPFSASLSVHFPPEEMGDDDELPPYLRKRALLNGPVEDEISRPPFESFSLFRGDMLVRKKFFGGLAETDYRSVGKFKGLVRILKHKDEPPLLNLDQFLTPQPYLVRVYVLDALSLQPKDANNKSDPYLRLSLGDGRKRNHLINDRDNYRKATLKPKFHRMYEFKAELPGPSDLRVEVLDYDFFALPNIPSGISSGLTSIGNTVGGDDFIGATIIDLEDRWFSDKWQQLGVNPDTYEKRKPLELRPLYAPFSTLPQGNVRLWVDILTEAEMALCKPVDISLPPSRFFEVRVIVYRARNVTPGDFTDLSDMFVKGWLQNRDDKAQLTDTHWRARDGKASFNWRMKFDIELPLEEDNEADRGYLHLQLWDKDVLYDDCLADSVVDLSVFLKQAYKTNSVVNVFAKKKEVRVRGTSVAANNAQGSSRQEASRAERISQGGGSSDHHEQEQSATALVSSQTPSLPRPGRPRSPSYQTDEPTSSTRPKRSTHKHKEKAEILVKSIKERFGMGDDPEDASWLTFTSRDPKTGDRVRAGELLVSVEILPSGVASMRAAGLGRSEPNNFPVLAEPADRLNLSAMWNPFYVLEALMGPKFYTAFTSGIVCALIIALIIFAGPLVNAFVTFLDFFPSPYGFVVFGLLLAIVLFSVFYFLYRCRRAIAAAEAQQ